MPPKTPKSGKEQKKAKEKKAEVRPKLNYGIFIINLEDKSLKPIVKQFQQALNEHDRRAVLGVSRDEVVIEILKQQAEKAKKAKENKAAATGKDKKGKKEEKTEKESKDKKGKKDKKDEKGGKDAILAPDNKPEKDTKIVAEVEEEKPINPEMFILDEKTFGQFYAQVKEQVDKLLKKSESIKNLLRTQKEFDLLKYWQEKGDGSTTKNVDKKGKGTDKETKEKKGKKDDRARGGAEKKGKEKKDEKPDKKGNKKGGKAIENADGCKLKEVTVVKLNEKPWSKIQPRISDEEIKYQYIEDHPLDGLDAYIVLLGNFGNDLYLELIKKSLPLRAISTFFPKFLKPEPDQEITNETMKEISELKRMKQTENIRLFTDFIQPMSECKVTRFKKEIYDELSWHLYDTEIMRRQYHHYLANIKEYDVEEKFPFPKDVNILRDSGLPENALDDNTIPIYLDTLLEIVHDALSSETEYTYEEMEEEVESEQNKLEEEDIFLTSYCNNNIIEGMNTLLKNTLASEIDEEFYIKIIEFNKMVMRLDKIWQKYANKRAKESNRMSIGTLYFIDIEHVTTFCEPLSGILSRQILKTAFDESDDVDYLYNAPQDNIVISFYHSRSILFESHVKSVIPTKLCFRDYCEYKASEIKDWMKEHEELYRQETAYQNVLKEFTEPEPPIADSDFFRFSSIKHKMLVKKTSLPNVSTNFDDIKKKGKGKEDKGSKTPNKKEVKGSKTPHKKEEKGSKVQKKETGKTDDLQNNSTIENSTFIAYNLEGTQQEINSYKAIYRSKRAILQLCKDIWADNHKIFRLKLGYAGNQVFYSRELPTNHYPATLRIETKNLMTIAFRHCPLPPLPSGEENEIQEMITEEEDYEEESYPHVTITWPSLLTIQNIYDRETQSITEIRQNSWRKSIKEKKRFMYSDGTVLVFFRNSAIHVLTANGTLYETGPPVEQVAEDDFVIPEATPENIFKQNKYQNEIEYLRRYHELLDCDNYMLTTAEGYNFEVKNGQIIAENHKFFTLEWYDYSTGERYSTREDGVKTITSEEHLICYYPDGTFITSHVEMYFLYRYLNEEFGTESFIIFAEEEGGHTVSAIHVTKSIIKELVNIASDEIFTYTNVSYLIQHECYASIRFDKEKDFLKDKVTIYSPDGVNISFSAKEAFIDLSGELCLNCTKDMCIIHGASENKDDIDEEEMESESSSLEGYINFTPVDEKEPLFYMEEESNTFRVEQDFHWAVDKDYMRPYTYRFEQKLITEILLESTLEGFSCYSQQEVSQFLKQVRKDPEAIVLQNQDFVTILTPLRTFDELFRLPIIELKDFLLKFEQNFVCPIKVEPETMICNTLSKIMTIRCFFRAEKLLRTLIPSVVNILARTSLGLRLSLSDGKIKNRDLLLYALNKSLEFHQMKLDNPEELCLTSTRKVRGIIPTTIDDILEMLRQRNKRQLMYKVMLRKKFYPKYWEFMEAGGHIKYINVCKYAKLLQVWDVVSDKCFTMEQCECPPPTVSSTTKTTSSGDIVISEEDVPELCVTSQEESMYENLPAEHLISCECSISAQSVSVCECPDTFEEIQEGTETILSVCECTPNSSELNICVCPSLIYIKPPCSCANVEKGTCACHGNEVIPCRCPQSEMCICDSTNVSQNNCFSSST